jgi:branched-chain amino acid transport system substrate-binding protein
LGAGALTACEPIPRVIGVSTSAPYVDAARMAVADALAHGPIPGLDTVMNSSGGNLAAPALETAAAMVSIPGLMAVVGHSNSAASLAAAPVYAEHEVVQISPTASAVLFSGMGPYQFRLVPPDDRQGAFLAEAVERLLPVGGRIALFYVNDDYGKGLRKAVVDRLDGTAYDVVVDLPHMEDDVTDTDITHTREALAATAPDAILWLARGMILNRYLDHIRRILPNAPILGGDGIESGSIDLSSERFVHVSSVTFLDLTASEELRAFTRRYEERFARRASAPDALTYDAIGLVVAGLRAGANDGAELRAYLTSLGRDRPVFRGITGPVAFDDDGNVERSYVLIRHGQGRR